MATCRYSAPLGHIILVASNPYLFLLLYVTCLAEKQHILFFVVFGFTGFETR